jgi:hypothetical protein
VSSSGETDDGDGDIANIDLILEIVFAILEVIVIIAIIVFSRLHKQEFSEISSEFFFEKSAEQESFFNLNININDNNESNECFFN